MMKKPSILLGVFALAASPSPGPSVPFPLTTVLEGPRGTYSDFLLQKVLHWPPPGLTYDRAVVNIRCLETPGNPFYVGALQTMTVQASLRDVEAVLDDIDHYDELFPGYAKIRVIRREVNKVFVSWEQKAPLFFVPNVKYETVTLVDHSDKLKTVYRYQLTKSDVLKANDGIIVLERIAPSVTKYTEYDFWDADWGVAKQIAPGRIWKDSIEGLFLSDAALKIKAENPLRTPRQALEEAEKLLERFPVDDALKTKELLPR